MLVNVSFDQVQSIVPPSFPPVKCVAWCAYQVCGTVRRWLRRGWGGDLETRSIYDWQDEIKTAQVSVPAGEGTGIDDQATRLIRVDITTTWPDYDPDDPAFQPRTDIYDDIPIRCDHGDYARR